MTLKRAQASHATLLHKWPLGAFSSLIDATQACNGVWIDVLFTQSNEPFFVIRDRGEGLSRSQLLARTAVSSPVRDWQSGRAYSSAWQAAAFRLGADVTILTKTRHACFAALLSRERIADLRHPHSESPNVVIKWHHSVSERDPQVASLCTYSPWQSVRELSAVFDSISPTGTLVAVSSLKRDLQQAQLELDLDTNRFDIRLSALPHKQHNNFISSIRLSHSLRSYLEMLYLNPTFRIHLRGRIVRERRLSASMFGRRNFVYNYTPPASSTTSSTSAEKRLVFQLGFDHAAHENEYGMLLYHNQRLIKPYVKLGFQIQPQNQIRVVAIVEADHLVPTPNMQAFEEHEAYQDLVFALGQSLKMFWAPYGSMTSVYRNHCNDPMLKWVRCDVCARWRRLGPNVPHPSDTSCALWTCIMNTGGTNACNQADDADDCKVPVSTLAQRPISPISPYTECQKRPSSSSSPSKGRMKRPRHSTTVVPSLLHIEPTQQDEALGTTSPIPNLQSPIGLDSCTPELVVSEGAELGTDPFSLNERDSPFCSSTSSPDNMLEKAARAKPLPNAVREEDSDVKCLETSILAPEFAKPPPIKSSFATIENPSKEFGFEKGISAADAHIQDFFKSSAQTTKSLLGDQMNRKDLSYAKTHDTREECVIQAHKKERENNGGQKFTPAIVPESQAKPNNISIQGLTRPEVVRHTTPVVIPLVREVVVHHSSQFVDVNNGTTSVQKLPVTRKGVPDAMILASEGVSSPLVAQNPAPYDAQPSYNSTERNCTQIGNRCENEEAIKLLLNLRTRELAEGQWDLVEGSKTLTQERGSDDIEPERNNETKVVADLTGASRSQKVAGADVDDYRQVGRDIPDPFGERSKPVSPAQNLLQTPTRSVYNIPPRGLSGNFGYMPGMPSPNTANPFLDLTADDMLGGTPLNDVDLSKDFLDLDDVGRLKTPAQRKIPSKGTPSNSRFAVRKSQLHVLDQFSPDTLLPEIAIGPGLAKQIVSDVETRGNEGINNETNERPHNPNALDMDERMDAREEGGHTCFGDRVGPRRRSRDNLVRRSDRIDDGGNEIKSMGSPKRVNSESLKASDISSLIPWSQIAATAAAAGAVAAAAAARDGGDQKKRNAPERKSSDESGEVQASQQKVEELKKDVQDQKNLTEIYKEKLQELICSLAPTVAGGVTKLLKNPSEIDVPQLSRDILTSVTEKAKEEAGMEQLQTIQSCKASEQIACSALERLRGLVRSFLEEAVGFRTKNEQDKPVDRHFEEYLNALDVFPL